MKRLTDKIIKEANFQWNGETFSDDDSVKDIKTLALQGSNPDAERLDFKPRQKVEDETKEILPTDEMVTVKWGFKGVVSDEDDPNIETLMQLGVDEQGNSWVRQGEYDRNGNEKWHSAICTALRHHH